MSYATGNVSGNVGVGGFIGSNYAYGPKEAMTAIYATGNVSGNSRVGGLIGSTNSDSSIINVGY